jgi:polyisoprenyl-teichoic acid--peptidoglycan teichoic acid transferase
MGGWLGRSSPAGYQDPPTGALPSGIWFHVGPRWVAWVFFGLVVTGLAIVLGGALALRSLPPGWWAVPGAVLQMTGQQVARTEPPPPRAPALPPATATPVAAAPRATPAATATAAPTPTPAPLLPTAPGPLLPQRRFTVLLLGSDDDLKFPADAVLTQSMILVSIDPHSREVSMLSIPRDFWVPIPGYGNQKIDVAYELGGIALARTTVERLFGVTVDYYAWVGLTGLVSVVDELGGIELTVLHPILDETYPDDLYGPDPYAFHRVYLPAGPQLLDGQTTLQYVRSRHGDLQSDFGRSARQQQVLLAIRRLADEPGFLARVPQLTSSLQEHVRTDLSLPAIAQLALLARDIPDSHIQRQVLSAPRFADLGYSPNGREQVVYPNWAAIRPEVAKLLHLNDS